MTISSSEHANLWAELDLMLNLPIIEKSEDKQIILSGTYILNSTFSGFSGHFPDYPILPALMQVLMVRHLMESVLQVNFECYEIKNAKFTSQGKPGDIVRAKSILKIDDQNDGVRVDAILEHAPYADVATQKSLQQELPWAELAQLRLVYKSVSPITNFMAN